MLRDSGRHTVLRDGGRDAAVSPLRAPEPKLCRLFSLCAFDSHLFFLCVFESMLRAREPDICLNVCLNVMVRLGLPGLRVRVVLKAPAPATICCKDQHNGAGYPSDDKDRRDLDSSLLATATVSEIYHRR